MLMLFYILLAVIVGLAAWGCFYPTGGNLESPLDNLAWEKYPGQRPGTPLPLPISPRGPVMSSVRERILRETEAELVAKLTQPEPVDPMVDIDMRHVAHQVQLVEPVPVKPVAPAGDLRTRTRGGGYQRLRPADGPGDDTAR